MVWSLVKKGDEPEIPRYRFQKGSDTVASIEIQDIWGNIRECQFKLNCKEGISEPKMKDFP